MQACSSQQAVVRLYAVMTTKICEIALQKTITPMKSTINPKHELANRLAKYLMSFDDNKEVNARMREELGKRLHKTEYDYTDYLKCLAKSGDVQSQYLLGLSYARGGWLHQELLQGHEVVD